MLQPCIRKIFVTVVIAMTFSTPAKATSETVYLLQQRIERITAVQEDLDVIQAQALDLQKRLSQKSRGFKDEILTKCKELDVQKFNVAITLPRMKYNMQLLSRLKGYIDALEARIQFLNTGHQQLQFLKLQASDELHLARTFNDIEANTLIRNIDTTLQTYEIAVSEPLFHTAKVHKPELQQVWAQVSNTP